MWDRKLILLIEDPKMLYGKNWEKRNFRQGLFFIKFKQQQLGSPQNLNLAFGFIPYPVLWHSADWQIFASNAHVSIDKHGDVSSNSDS
jgi:hypothetical protein